MYVLRRLRRSNAFELELVMLWSGTLPNIRGY